TVTNGNELVFTPTDNGTYVATAHVTDNGGGSDSVDSLPIVVNNVAPTAGIAGAPSGAVNENAPLTFTSNSTDPGSADTFTYAWSVTKDGDPYALPDTVDTTGAAFTFTPGHSGSYVVSMTITDKDGASDSTSTAAITVDNVAPTGTINGPTAANEGDALTLTAEPVDGADNTLTYAWSVEKDGNPFTLPGDAVTDQQAFDFTPPDQGSYVFTCTVTDDQGASNDLTQTVTVANVAPTVALQAMPTLAKEGVAVTLGSDVTDPGVNDTLVYGWTIKKDGVAYPLPNGTVDDQPTFTFTPTDNGTYTATLTVLDGDGGSTTVHGASFVVGNVAPSASIDVPGSTPVENQPVTLTSTVTDASPDDQAAGFTYEWIAQRDGEVTDTGFDDSFTFTPTVHGVYTITLVATDKDGGVSSTSTDLEVGNVAPSNAAITGLPSAMTEADSATLTASAGDAPDDSLTYQWTVTRNGNAFAQASGDSFNFSPHVRGDFGITLTATDSAGASTSTTQSISVANVAPSVSLTQPKYTVLLGENAPFKVSLGDVPKNQSLAMTIDFGDGTVKQETFTGNQVNLGLNHTYADAGNYSVSVSVSDGVSVSSVTKSVTVSRAAVRMDPLDSTKTALVVVGSDSADDINVYTAGTRRYGVIYDGQILGSSYYPTGRVVISGGAGADDIQVNATLPALIFAGDSGSTLKGGNGNDILVGGSGAEYIDGRGGRDIIISQGGPDTLLGGDGEDLILPSLAAWANNTASLKSIYATWNGSGATADRLAALQSGGLFSNQAVTTDSVSDIIYGQGGADAFVGVGATDRIRDFTTGDVTQS
ncbi:MAG: PKD domain-containing protein, partial [Tepidisphaeraceae bacterium]